MIADNELTHTFLHSNSTSRPLQQVSLLRPIPGALLTLRLSSMNQVTLWVVEIKWDLYHTFLYLQAKKCVLLPIADKIQLRYFLKQTYINISSHVSNGDNCHKTYKLAPEYKNFHLLLTFLMTSQQRQVLLPCHVGTQ